MRILEFFWFRARKKSPNVLINETREVRKVAERYIADARASLDGEDGWFLCLQKVPGKGKTSFVSCTPEGVSHD